MNFRIKEMKTEIKELAMIAPMHKRETRVAQSKWDKAKAKGLNSVHLEPHFRYKNHLMIDNKVFTRYLLLAYGYLRGLDYLDIENSVREGNEPNLQMLEEVFEYFQVHEDPYDGTH